MKNRIAFFLVFISLSTFSQEQERIIEEPLFKNSLSLTFGYTYIRDGEDLNSTKKGVFVPAIGVDYFRKLNHKWSVGIISDIELADYIIVSQGLDRSKALLFVGGASYEFTKHFGVFVGGGIEFEKHKNLAILRTSVEFPFEIGERYFLKPEFVFDFKEGYDTYTISIGYGVRF